eukprot:m.482665 g.482665  ORF g.482665 m.482665 type:complete len:108 (-) comp22625_c0_seq1:127-450(-)
MSDPRVRQLKIKAGVVKRLGKERAMNVKEIAREEERLEKFRADPAKDEYDEKKQLEVLEECRKMVPNTQQRLEAAVAELKAMLDAETDLSGTAEYKDAEEQLAVVEA